MPSEEEVLTALDFPASLISCSIAKCDGYVTHTATCRACGHALGEWCMDHRYDAGTDERPGTCRACKVSRPLGQLLTFHTIDKDTA